MAGWTTVFPLWRACWTWWRLWTLLWGEARWPCTATPGWGGRGCSSHATLSTPRGWLQTRPSHMWEPKGVCLLLEEQMMLNLHFTRCHSLLTFHSCNHTHLHIPRSGSIQTRSQIEIVLQFDLFLSPLWNFYPPTPCESSSTFFTFEEYLQNQSLLLHGAEQANLKYIPKVRCNFPNNGKKTCCQGNCCWVLMALHTTTVPLAGGVWDLLKTEGNFKGMPGWDLQVMWLSANQLAACHIASDNQQHWGPPRQVLDPQSLEQVADFRLPSDKDEGHPGQGRSQKPYPCIFLWWCFDPE